MLRSNVKISQERVHTQVYTLIFSTNIWILKLLGEMVHLMRPCVAQKNPIEILEYVGSKIVQLATLLKV